METHIWHKQLLYEGLLSKLLEQKKKSLEKYFVVLYMQDKFSNLEGKSPNNQTSYGVSEKWLELLLNNTPPHTCLLQVHFSLSA